MKEKMIYVMIALITLSVSGLLGGCSDEEKAPNAGVNCSIEGLLIYSEALNTWTISSSDSNTIDNNVLYVVTDYSIQLSKDQTSEVVASGIRYPYEKQIVLPAGTSIYYFTVKSLSEQAPRNE